MGAFSALELRGGLTNQDIGLTLGDSALLLLAGASSWRASEAMGEPSREDWELGEAEERRDVLER